MTAKEKEKDRVARNAAFRRGYEKMCARSLRSAFQNLDRAKTKAARRRALDGLVTPTLHVWTLYRSNGDNLPKVLRKLANTLEGKLRGPPDDDVLIETLDVARSEGKKMTPGVLYDLLKRLHPREDERPKYRGAKRRWKQLGAFTPILTKTGKVIELP